MDDMQKETELKFLFEKYVCQLFCWQGWVNEFGRFWGVVQQDVLEDYRVAKNQIH